MAATVATAARKEAIDREEATTTTQATEAKATEEATQATKESYRGEGGNYCR